LSAIWQQPALVDPRPGANEIIAADLVAKAPADGYTLFIGTESTFANNAYLFSKLPYDPLRDLVPVSRLYDIQFGLIVNGKLPASSMAEFVALMKKEPGKYNYASTGAGTAPHLGMESLRQATGIPIMHVPYKGTPQVIQDLLGGTVDAVMGSTQIAAPYAADGRLRMLAISGSERQKIMPSVPTFTEAGFPQVDVRTFVGLAVPAGTPDAIRTRLQADFATVLRSSDFRQKVLEPNGYDAVTSTPAEFREFLARKRPQVQQQIRALGIKLD
jgi:tripartite-type tricarboxylate transporter receptor subunit TctC